MVSFFSADRVVEVRAGAVGAALVDGVAGGALAFEGAFAAGNVSICEQQAEVEYLFLFAAGAACICNFDTLCKLLTHSF